MAFDRPLEVGLDPWGGPIRDASARGVYCSLVQAAGARMPFPAGSFASAFSNSVLEHILDVEPVLVETARVLRPGAPFVFCVPNHNFDPNLSVARSLERFGLSSWAAAYRRFFDRIARPRISTRRRYGRGGWSGPALSSCAGGTTSPRRPCMPWSGHHFGLPSLVARKLSGSWILAPTRWNLALTPTSAPAVLRRALDRENGVCTFYIARRT